MRCLRCRMKPGEENAEGEWTLCWAVFLRLRAPSRASLPSGFQCYCSPSVSLSLEVVGFPSFQYSVSHWSFQAKNKWANQKASRIWAVRRKVETGRGRGARRDSVQTVCSNPSVILALQGGQVLWFKSILGKLAAQTIELLEAQEKGDPRKQGKCSERRRIQVICCQ